MQRNHQAEILAAQIKALQTQQAEIEAKEKEEQAKREDELKNACSKGDMQIVKQLLASGVRGNLEAELREACYKGHLELVQLLIDAGVNIDCSNGYYYAPTQKEESDKPKKPYLGDAIHNAIKGDQPEVLALLIEHAAKLFQQKIKQRIEKMHPYSDDPLETFYPDIDVLAGQIANVIDAKKSRYSRETLLSLINHREQSLLVEAIIANSEKCVNYLANTFKDVRYSRVLRYSSMSQCPPDSDYCHRHDLDHNTIVLMDDMETENEKSVNTWVVYWGENSYPAKKSLKESMLSPEMVAAFNFIKVKGQHLENTIPQSTDKALIKNITTTFGCIRENPLFQLYDWKGDSYNTVQGGVLSLAIDRGRDDLAVFLIENGADIEEKYGNKIERQSSSFGWSSSYHDAWDGKRDLTPLLLAAKKNNKGLIQLLLSHGADISAKDRNGKTAADLTTDPVIKSVLNNTHTFAGRLGRLNNIEPIPVWHICPLSKKMFEDPICIDGTLYDRKAYMLKDPQLASSAKTVTAVVLALEDFVNRQERNAHIANTQDSSVRMGMFGKR